MHARTDEAPNTKTNPLIVKLNEFCNKENFPIESLSSRLGFTNIGWAAIIHGKRDIRNLSIDSIRSIAAILSISCLEALMLGELLSNEDLAC